MPRIPAMLTMFNDRDNKLDLAVIDTESLSVVTTIPPATGPGGVAVTPQ
jgi:YVTN family beta-propeller protein